MPLVTSRRYAEQMKIRILLLVLLPFVCFLRAYPEKVSEIRRIEVRMYLREFAWHALMYTSENNEQFPSKIDDIKEGMKDEKKLIQFINDPNFSYEASGVSMSEIDEDTILCGYRFPGKGREVIYCFGNTKWIDEEE